MLQRRREKRDVEFMEAMLDALADEFGGELPGVDSELGPDASDPELAQALCVSGAFLLGGLVGIPPVGGKGKDESDAYGVPRSATQTGACPSCVF